MNIKDGNGPSKTLIGSPDDDLFVVDDLGDRVIEEGNGGTYIVEKSVEFTLSGFLDYGPPAGEIAIGLPGDEEIAIGLSQGMRK